MKRIIILLILFSISLIIFPQTAYYGASRIKSDMILKSGSSFRFNPESVHELASVLKAYLPEKDIKNQELTDAQVLIKFKTNPFFGRQIDTLLNAGAGADITGLFSQSLSSLGNLNVTNFADGLAKFLVERGKEELNIAFFDQFRAYLDRYPEVQVIFPTSYKFLNEILSYQYNAMLPALRAAFQKDLNAFTANILDLRDIHKYPEMNDTNAQNRVHKIIKFFGTPEGRAITAAIIVSDGVIKGINAAEIINNLSGDPLCVNYLNEDIPNLILFTNLISNSLRSEEDGRIWISRQEVNSLVNDQITLKLYLGLIYAIDKKSDRKISFPFLDSDSTLQALLVKMSNDWNSVSSINFRSAFNSLATNFSECADNSAGVLASIQKGDQPSMISYGNLTSTIADLFISSTNFIHINNASENEQNSLKEIDRFIKAIGHSMNAAYDIKYQNYSALVMEISAILGQIFPDYDEMDQKFIKYGTFMANIVEAKNSDEVKAAIDAAVLPVGSASIKRETQFNISLNSFIGPFAGLEYLPALKTDQWAPSLGVTAPVGVAFSWGTFGKDRIRQNGNKTGGKSISIFVPVIDIGAMASFRMGNDSSEVASEVKLANIISPGLYVYYGFGKCPISVGLGAQAGPQLREVTATEINIDKNFYVRFGLNIVVDIPLFNIYTKN